MTPSKEAMAIFLGVATLVPLIHWLGERDVVAGDVHMKLEDVVSIASKKQYISWDDFDGYIYTDQSRGKEREHMYVISGRDFEDTYRVLK